MDNKLQNDLTVLDPQTSITFKNRFGEYAITRNKDIVHIDDIIEDLIAPVLIAASYHPDNVYKALGVNGEDVEKGET